MTILLKKNQTETTKRDDQFLLTQEKNQYNLWQILTIWLTGSALMWIMGWVIYPALSRNIPVVEAGLLRMKLLTVGLIWQFVLSMIILYVEEGNLRLATIRRRFWLNTPMSPKSGHHRRTCAVEHGRPGPDGKVRYPRASPPIDCF